MGLVETNKGNEPMLITTSLFEKALTKAEAVQALTAANIQYRFETVGAYAGTLKIPTDDCCTGVLSIRPTVGGFYSANCINHATS